MDVGLYEQFGLVDIVLTAINSALFLKPVTNHCYDLSYSTYKCGGRKLGLEYSLHADMKKHRAVNIHFACPVLYTPSFDFKLASHMDDV
jgi:hypothetical protein